MKKDSHSHAHSESHAHHKPGLEEKLGGWLYVIQALVQLTITVGIVFLICYWIYLGFQ